MADRLLSDGLTTSAREHTLLFQLNLQNDDDILIARVHPRPPKVLKDTTHQPQQKGLE